MDSVGILGGTFDPIHYGHLTLAEDAMFRAGLAKIIFVPAARPPHKDNYRVQSSEHRVAMVKHAINYNPKFELSTIELERTGPSYTVDTVYDLKQKYSTSDLYYIMGLDAFLTLYEWKEADRLVNLCRFIILTRPGYNRAEAELASAWPAGSRPNFSIIELRQVDISSQELRSKILKREAITGLVPRSVEQYIKTNRLYLG